MSVGLGDLNKKRRVHAVARPLPIGAASEKSLGAKPGTEVESPLMAKSAVTTASVPEVINAEATAPSIKMKSIYRRSITARPWTDSGAVKAPKRSRPRVDNADVSLNDDWIRLQTEPIFWIDFREHSTLFQLNERLSQLEAKFEEVVISPIRAFTSFFKSRTTNQN